VVEADHVPVGRDRYDAELVDLVELRGLGGRGAGHAAELVVEPEVVLQRDRRKRLVLLLDLDAFLGLDRLVHTLVVAAAVQDAAGELVDDEDLAVHDDVVLVALEQLLGLECVVEVADERRVDGLVEVVDAELVLDLLDRGLSDGHRALAFVALVVGVTYERAGEPGELVVPLHVEVGRAADDERRPRLVDEDRVDLVDDGEVVAALRQLVGAPCHVVAQVVEAELVVGAVGDVTGVGSAALDRRHVAEDHADGEAEVAVDAAHPLGVALGEVVVDRDDVDALAGDRVEVRRQHAGQRLALAGAHLGDVAEMQRGASHDLDVEVPLAQRPLGSLPDGGERLGENVVETLAVGVPLPEGFRLPAQLRVAHGDEVVLDRVDLVRDVAELAQDATLARAQDPVENCHGAALLGWTVEVPDSAEVPAATAIVGRCARTRSVPDGPALPSRRVQEHQDPSPAVHRVGDHDRRGGSCAAVRAQDRRDASAVGGQRTGVRSRRGPGRRGHRRAAGRDRRP
jgi:hypothetical protein